MKELNRNTKLAKELISNYMNSTKYSLYNCYVKPSKNKRDEYQECIDIMNKMNGKNKRIPTYNRYYFSFAFIADNQLIYITKTQIYAIDIEER